MARSWLAFRVFSCMTLSLVSKLTILSVFFSCEDKFEKIFFFTSALLPAEQHPSTKFSSDKKFFRARSAVLLAERIDEIHYSALVTNQCVFYIQINLRKGFWTWFIVAITHFQCWFHKCSNPTMTISGIVVFFLSLHWRLVTIFPIFDKMQLLLWYTCCHCWHLGF